LLAAPALVALAAPTAAQAPLATTTPIEHLIVVVGENLSFDNLFGIYEPRSGAGGLDDVSTVLGDLGIDEFAACAFNRASVPSSSAPISRL